MTYDSTEDRRLETSSADDLATEAYMRFNPRSAARCPWCLRPINRHGDLARDLCEQRFSEVLNRRLTGPTRVSDVAKGGRP